MKLDFVQHFAADEVMKLNLGRDSEARFGQDFELLGYWRFLVDALSRF